MALHDDLLAQAGQLAHLEKNKPKQANLRRAVSAAYYAQADYDLARAFTRGEVEALVARAQTAFTSWASVSGSSEADVFLVALLAKGRT